MYDEKSHVQWYKVSERGIERAQGTVIGESRWVLYLNNHEFVTFMATARDLHHLALGFLASENLIADLSEVASLRVNLAPDSAYWFIPALGLNEKRAMPICEEGVGSIQVRLTREQFAPPTHRTITSGCGGGTTFDDLSAKQTPLESARRIRPSQIFTLMHAMNQRATLYRECRGVHTSALGDGDQILALAEDVGRHNTLDKLRGDCMLRGIATRDGVLLSTGRISSEMMMKAAKMEIPIVVSRTSPTHLAVQLAQAWNITLVGYAHAGEMLVYHGIERIETAERPEGTAERSVRVGD